MNREQKILLCAAIGQLFFAALGIIFAFLTDSAAIMSLGVLGAFAAAYFIDRTQWSPSGFWLCGEDMKTPLSQGVDDGRPTTTVCLSNWVPLRRRPVPLRSERGSD